MFSFRARQGANFQGKRQTFKLHRSSTTAPATDADLSPVQNRPLECYGLFRRLKKSLSTCKTEAQNGWLSGCYNWKELLLKR